MERIDCNTQARARGFFSSGPGCVARLAAMLFVLCLYSGCGIIPNVTSSPHQQEQQQAQEAFDNAQQLLQQGQKKAARHAFQEYVQKYPRQPMAAKALMRLGEIAMDSGDLEGASRAFGLVFRDYPSDANAPAARLMYAKARLAAGAPEDVVPAVKELLAEDEPQHLREDAYALEGRAFMALKQPKRALFALAWAQALATSRDKKEALLEQLEKAVGALSSHSIESLLKEMKGCLPAGLLLMELAQRSMDTGNFDFARKLLTRLRNNCPSHPRIKRVLQMLEQVEQFQRFKTGAIGCLAPLSGPYAAYGEQIVSGVELAVASLNAKGQARPFTLLVRDSQGTSQGADKGFFQLAEAGAVAVIGPLAAAGGVREIAKELELPVMVFSQKKGVTSPGGYVFRNYLTPRLQCKALVNHAMASGAKRFAILFPNDAYGNTFMNAFWDQVLEHGAVVTGVESYSPDAKDFAAPVKKLVGLYYPRPYADKARVEDEKKDEKPKAIVDFDAVFIPDAPMQAGLVLPQLPYYDINKVQVMGTNLWHSHILLDVAGRYARNAVFPAVFFANSNDPGVKRFVAAYKSTYGKIPGFLAALGYDSANLLMELVRRPGVHDGPSLRRALAETRNFPGVTGSTGFDDSGEPEKKPILLRVGRRGFIQIPQSR